MIFQCLLVCIMLSPHTVRRMTGLHILLTTAVRLTGRTLKNPAICIRNIGHTAHAPGIIQKALLIFILPSSQRTLSDRKQNTEIL